MLILIETFLFNGLPLLTLSSCESWIEEKLTSKAHQKCINYYNYYKKAMRVYAAELICSTGVLGFHTFKLVLRIYNMLHSHAEILS